MTHKGRPSAASCRAFTSHATPVVCFPFRHCYRANRMVAARQRATCSGYNNRAPDRRNRRGSADSIAENNAMSKLEHINIWDEDDE